MPRRSAVLLTSSRSIPNFSLFCTFCTHLQKSEAHPLPLQSLPGSLQKPRVCHQQRSPVSADRASNLQTSLHAPPLTPRSSSLFCTRAQAIPFLFNPLRTLCVFTRDATHSVVPILELRPGDNRNPLRRSLSSTDHGTRSTNQTSLIPRFFQRARRACAC
jgi:hypothetical protein